MKFKYMILGNIAGALGFGAIATVNLNIYLSVAMGVSSGIISNYMVYSMKKEVNELINNLLYKVGLKVVGMSVIDIDKKVREDINDYDLNRDLAKYIEENREYDIVET